MVCDAVESGRGLLNRSGIQDDFITPLSGTAEIVRRDTDRILSEIAGGIDRTDPFAAAVRATRMPMIITDPRQPDNPIIFVNDAFCRLTGYDRAEIVGRNCRFLQGPGTDKDDVARIRMAVAARQKIEIAIYNYRKDGTPFWNQLLLAPVKDAHGEVAYFFASQYDVTADFAQLSRLKGENAVLAAKNAASSERLQFSELVLHMATEAAEIGVWDVDLVSNTLTWSDRTQEMFGMNPGEPVTLDVFFAGLHPDDREATRTALEAALDPAQRASYDVEYRTVGPYDGRVRWIAAKGRGLFDENFRCIRAVGTVIDITARKDTEERLRRSEADPRDWEIIAALALDEDALEEYDERDIARVSAMISASKAHLEAQIAQGHIPADEIEALRARDQERSKYLLSKAIDTIWQLSSGRLRKARDVDPEDLYGAFYPLFEFAEDVPDDEMLRLEAEGAHRIYFINPATLDFVSMPTHAYLEGEASSAAEALDTYAEVDAASAQSVENEDDPKPKKRASKSQNPARRRVRRRR